MTKNSTPRKGPKTVTKNQKRDLRRQAATQRVTVGLDLGDRTTRYCVLQEAGEVISEGSLATTKGGLCSLLEKMPRSRVALEVGTHSPWVSRLLAGFGHEVVVANPRNVQLITRNERKNDRLDAERLARLARIDPQLLSPIHHRGEQAQADLAVIRARARLVDVRTQLINAARGLAKPMGERLKECDADQAGESLAESMPESVRAAIGPLLKIVESITEQIRVYDHTIQEIARRYPEIELLRTIYGVGILTALTFVLTIEDPGRFTHSRDVGAYFGLRPKQRDSGERQPELGISQAGDRLMRRYLVQAAHAIIRKGAPDSDLQAWAIQKLASGGKKAKRRVVVALARKLAVLLHHLWANGEVYDPQYNRKLQRAGKVAA